MLHQTEVIHRCEGAQITLFQVNNPETFRLATFDDGSVACPACGLILTTTFPMED